ncbi:MAG: protein SCO1/2 [Lentisphaeria bacterium]|jgi:protein SCO1/2
MKVAFRFVILLYALIGFISTAQSGSVPYEVLRSPKALPDFSLVDHDANMFGLPQFKGHWSLVFLGFTSCPDICPMTMSRLEAVRADLGLRFTPEKIPDVVFVAVDPQRDQVILGEYLRYFHPDNIGITGEEDQLQTLVKGMDAYYRIDKEAVNSASYEVVHTSAIAVINPKAEMVAKISPPFKVNETAEFLVQLIRKGPLSD